MPSNLLQTPQSRSFSELAGNVPQPTLTKTAEQLELELARKNAEVRELWQMVATTTQPKFSTCVASPPSMATPSPLSKRENPQNQEELETRHNSAPEVVVESLQVRTLTCRNPLVPQRLENDTAESTVPTPPDLEARDLRSVIGPTIAKIAHAMEGLVECHPDVGLAIVLSVTTLCLTTIYVLYSIIYAHMGYIFICFLAVVATYSIRRCLSIIKQTEVAVRQEEAQIKREEVQQEWIRSIGSKLQNQLPADSWSQPVHGRRALMPVENTRIEEID